MGGAVIELDLTQPWEPEPPPASRWPPRLSGWLLPVVVTVATLLSVSAAAAPRRWEPVLSLREANTTLRFGPDDTAFVVTQRTRSGRLQAYPPGQTRPRWTLNFPGGYPMPMFVADDPGLMVLSVFDADPAGLGTSNAVQARDAQTGRLLWARPDTNLLGVGPGVAVVTNGWEAVGPVRPPGTDGAATPTAVIEAVDRRTGGSRWSRSVPVDVLVEWSADAVVELAPDGHLRLSDASTGAPRREVRIVLTAQPFHVHLDGDLAVVYQQLPDGDPADQIAVAYDLATGAERWRENALRLSDCDAPYRCEADAGRLTVTDTASGAVRYHGPGDRYLLRGDRLIVTAETDPVAPPGTRAYDLRTGRLAYTLPGWIFVGSGDPPGWIRTGLGPRAGLMIQPLAGSGLLVAALDDTTGRPRVLGRTTDWTGSAYCVQGRRHVGCAGVSGVRIWRPDR